MPLFVFCRVIFSILTIARQLMCFQIQMMGDQYPGWLFLPEGVAVDQVNITGFLTLEKRNPFIGIHEQQKRLELIIFTNLRKLILPVGSEEAANF